MLSSHHSVTTATRFGSLQLRSKPSPEQGLNVGIEIFTSEHDQLLGYKPDAAYLDGERLNTNTLPPEGIASLTRTADDIKAEHAEIQTSDQKLSGIPNIAMLIIDNVIALLHEPAKAMINRTFRQSQVPDRHQPNASCPGLVETTDFGIKLVDKDYYRADKVHNAISGYLVG